MAPWGPVVAPPEPRCSSWTFIGFVDPHSSVPCRHDDLRDDKFASPRGELDKGEHVPVGSRHVSSPPSPSHRDRLQEELKGVHSRFHIKEVADFSLTRLGSSRSISG